MATIGFASIATQAFALRLFTWPRHRFAHQTAAFFTRSNSSNTKRPLPLFRH